MFNSLLTALLVANIVSPIVTVGLLFYMLAPRLNFRGEFAAITAAITAAIDQESISKIRVIVENSFSFVQRELTNQVQTTNEARQNHIELTRLMVTALENLTRGADKRHAAMQTLTDTIKAQQVANTTHAELMQKNMVAAVKERNSILEELRLQREIFDDWKQLQASEWKREEEQLAILKRVEGAITTIDSKLNDESSDKSKK